MFKFTPSEAKEEEEKLDHAKAPLVVAAMTSWFQWTISTTCGLKLQEEDAQEGFVQPSTMSVKGTLVH